MSGGKTQKKVAAWRFGVLAETLCAWSLALRGYRVLARRFRVPSGEIDIIARRRGVLALVEVKARSDWLAAAEALGPKQRRRIARAAEAFLQKRPDLAELAVRFDVMLVRPGGLPQHLEDAWRIGD